MNRQITTAILLAGLLLLTIGGLLHQYLVAVLLSLVVAWACIANRAES